MLMKISLQVLILWEKILRWINVQYISRACECWREIGLLFRLWNFLKSYLIWSRGAYSPRCSRRECRVRARPSRGFCSPSGETGHGVCFREMMGRRGAGQQGRRGDVRTWSKRQEAGWTAREEFAWQAHQKRTERPNETWMWNYLGRWGERYREGLTTAGEKGTGLQKTGRTIFITPKLSILICRSSRKQWLGVGS